MGMIAGIGFTMSLFITNLAFDNPEIIKVSKISILMASLIAAIGGVITLVIGTKQNNYKETESYNHSENE